MMFKVEAEERKEKNIRSRSTYDVYVVSVSRVRCRVVEITKTRIKNMKNCTRWHFALIPANFRDL